MNTSRAAAFAAALLAASALPAIAQPTPGMETPQGQMSDAMVQKVGTALRHVALIRQQYSQRAQATNSTQQQQALADQANTDMHKAITEQGLSVQQYQAAIQAAQKDEGLKQRLLSVAQAGD